MIPLVDLKAQYASIKPEIDAAIQAVLDSAAFIKGPQVASFEETFAAFCGVRHVVGVQSGTAALHLALMAPRPR
jgi:dTDP-4-amino-4,6-dideoxygalactose transaminase